MNAVIDTGLKRANVIILVIDKPEFLSKPLEILHASRKSKKEDAMHVVDDIQAGSKILKSSSFAAALSNPEYKDAIIMFHC